MDFTRSLTSPNHLCTVETKQQVSNFFCGIWCSLFFNLSIFQVNQITHWLDASNVYGSTEEEIEMLRTHKDGQMKITKARSHPRSTTPEINLPSCPASLDIASPSDEICKFSGCVNSLVNSKAPCFLAGRHLNVFLFLNS